MKLSILPCSLVMCFMASCSYPNLMHSIGDLLTPAHEEVQNDDGQSTPPGKSSVDTRSE